MRSNAARFARTFLALTTSAALFTACTATEAPTSPSSGSGGGNVPVQPAPITAGALAVTISGLPFGVTADLTVTGPGGFSRSVTTSGTLAELSPGRYTVASNTVRVITGESAGAYAPANASQFIDVSAGPPTSIVVAYAPLVAVVDVTISGLPQGVGALVRLTAPNGGDVSVPASLRIAPATAGRWQLTAANVSDAGYSYAPTPTARDGNVTPGDTLRMPVQYTIATGALAVAVTGLPASASVTVAISGPAGFSRSVTGTATLTDLAPGSYTVNAPAVTVAGISYAPSAATQTVVVEASLVAAPAVIAYAAQVGSIAISATGLPSGATASFTLTASVGGTTRTVAGDATGSASIDSLVPGSYTVTAGMVTSGGFAYGPATATVSVAVVARVASTARFVYGVTTGVLAVTTSGLPASMGADIVVSGPGGFVRPLSSSATLTALSPGRYTVAARDVRSSSAGTYVATPTSRGVDIVAGGAVVTATVTYTPAPAVVEVEVTGLPIGTSPAVTLTPPTGEPIAVTAAATRIVPAAAGRWRLAAATVTAGGSVYVPTPTTRDSTVVLGDTLRLPVQYTLTTGAIALAVTGLPQGAQGSITITGPSSYRSTPSTTGTLTGLRPGAYTVTAANVTVGGLPYVPAPASQQVTVSASVIAAPAPVHYAVPGGRISFSLTGLPAGVAPVFTMTGPNGTSTITGNAVLHDQTPGTYVVSAQVVSGGGVTYTPTPASRTLTVGINTTAFATFSYASSGGGTNGRLAFAVSGLPTGANPSFSLSGSGGSTTIVGTATLDPVAAGSYTLTANPVTSGGATYTPTPSSLPITISTGATATATISYSTGGGGGSPNMAIENVYLTQATQRPDGGVTLIAGRDALLRAFVTANGANTWRPDVRVRIYDGATLLQTVVLTAPESSVRTAIAEGVMASTWNTVVLGANIRPTTRVLVEVDPSATITESDRTDNVWPRGGTPKPITVATAPPFNVRFVPVNVAGLTGNVSDANKEQFLTSTRRMMPIGAVVSDVRAPFTTTAPTLQSNDANGAWLTVLSELNALRTSDGAVANQHYYGVVKVSYNSGIAGYGYVPGRTAIGWDYLPSGDEVAVHEWGHNFSRQHSPCSVSGDAAYPYAGGVIGMYGWNYTTNSLVDPSRTDVMGYCSNQWISDWTWTKVLEFRQSSGLQRSAPRIDGALSNDGLLIWGRVVDGRIVLEPAFRVKAPATPLAARGTHRVELLNARGATLLELPLTTEQVDHATDHDERQFAVVVPWSAALEASLARVRVRDARAAFGGAELASASITTGTAPNVMPSLPDPDAELTPVSATRTRVRWNTSAYPMAVVRDATSGAIMGFVRNSGAEIVTNGRRVEVVYSDGVRSVVRK